MIAEPGRIAAPGLQNTSFEIASWPHAAKGGTTPAGGLLAAAGNRAGRGVHFSLGAGSEQRARRRLATEEGMHAIEHGTSDATLVGRINETALFIRIGYECGFHQHRRHVRS